MHERATKRLEYKTNNISDEEVNSAVEDILNSVMNKISRRNIDALGKVQFSARIDFSADGGLRIAEIENIDSIETQKPCEEISNELETLLFKIKMKKQKELLRSNFLDLKQTFINEGEKAFNKKYNFINGLGRQTKKMLISHFKTNT